MICSCKHTVHAWLFVCLNIRKTVNIVHCIKWLLSLSYQVLLHSSAICLVWWEKATGYGSLLIMSSKCASQPVKAYTSESGRQRQQFFKDFFFFIFIFISCFWLFMCCFMPGWLLFLIFPLSLAFLLSPLLSRYYFPGWYNSGNLSYAHRYGVSKGMESPVMDDCVMAYQFFQVS